MSKTLMTDYTIWFGGENSWDTCYLAEIGAVKLTEEQISKYFTFNENGKIEFDKEVIVDKINESEETDDFPNWLTITDNSLYWGPYVDQNVGVCISNNDDNPIFTEMVDNLAHYSKNEILQNIPQEEDQQETAICELTEELEYSEGVWIVYNCYEKGGYSGTFSIPDEEEFDSKKLVVEVVEIANNFNVVYGARYNNEDISMEGDSIGKGVDYYLYYQGELISIC